MCVLRSNRGARLPLAYVSPKDSLSLEIQARRLLAWPDLVFGPQCCQRVCFSSLCAYVHMGLGLLSIDGQGGERGSSGEIKSLPDL